MTNSRPARALIVGHLDLDAVVSLGFNETQFTDASSPQGAMAQFVEGLRAAKQDIELKVVPWGPGVSFIQALENLPEDPWLVSVGMGSNDWLEKKGTGPLYIEMGHRSRHDWGTQVLSKLADVAGSNEWSPNELIEAVEQTLAGRRVYLATSTSRPLLGLAGTSALDPQLKLRASTNDLSRWRDALAEKYGQLPLLQMGEDAGVHVGNLPGGGAGGGAAAALMAIGMRAYPTGQVLAEALNARRLVDAADLVVVANPTWHSPDLGDAAPLVAASIASEQGKTTVGIGYSSSLSSHERAEWGLHGLHVKNPKKTWSDLGRRVGQTWFSNYVR